MVRIDPSTRIPIEEWLQEVWSEFVDPAIITDIHGLIHEYSGCNEICETCSREEQLECLARHKQVGLQLAAKIEQLERLVERLDENYNKLRTQLLRHGETIEILAHQLGIEINKEDEDEELEWVYPPNADDTEQTNLQAETTQPDSPDDATMDFEDAAGNAIPIAEDTQNYFI